jgi:translation initiation factor 5
MTVNIGRVHADDPFYRYKMPTVVIKEEGRGNGSKSVFVNVDAVAAAIGREPTRLVKYLGKGLGTRATYDKKQSMATLGGFFSPTVMQEAVQDFVDFDVLCGSCGNPETVLEMKKGSERRRCKACGEKTGS